MSGPFFVGRRQVNTMSSAPGYTRESTGPVVTLTDDLTVAADHAQNVYLVCKADRAKQRLTIKLPSRAAYHARHRRLVHVRVRNESLWVNGQSERDVQTVLVELGDGFIMPNNASRTFRLLPERSVTFGFPCLAASLGPNAQVRVSTAGVLNVDAPDFLRPYFDNEFGQALIAGWDDDRLALPTGSATEAPAP